MVKDPVYDFWHTTLFKILSIETIIKAKFLSDDFIAHNFFSISTADILKTPIIKSVERYYRKKKLL